MFESLVVGKNKEPGAQTHDLVDLEKLLLVLLLQGKDKALPKTIFVLGAPRTGSTVLYQALSARLGLPYISNFTNDHFARTPIIGLVVQKACPVEISFTSQYGKTIGRFQPSEGSGVMAHWFGGGHPSALVSNKVREGKLSHFVSTLAAAEALFGRPLVIKNAWNCFRVRFLAEAIPSSCFVWIRRKVAAAAKSDLAARYVTKGSPNTWNSATPANVDALRQLPPAGQVVENQYEFDNAIGSGLKGYAANRWMEVRYEEFCCDPEGVLDHIGRVLAIPSVPDPARIQLTPAGSWKLPDAAKAAVDAYVEEHRERLRSNEVQKDSEFG